MNAAIASVCSKAGDAEKGNIEIRPAVPFVSEATYDKDKQKFVDITCRYSPSGADSKKNNYQIHVRIFNHSTPEDMLLWYSKIQDIFVKKPCDDAETKFNINYTNLFNSSFTSGDDSRKTGRSVVCISI